MLKAMKCSHASRFASMLGLLLLLAVSAGAAGTAQDGGNWRAANSTAKAITGDIALFNQKIALGFSAFTLAQIRSLKPEEILALFNGAGEPGGTGNLYRTSIPAEKRLLHKNTLCGSEETQWVVTYATGKELEVAFFSSAKMPVLTPEAMANTTDLCGTFTYVR